MLLQESQLWGAGELPAPAGECRGAIFVQDWSVLWFRKHEPCTDRHKRCVEKHCAASVTYFTWTSAVGVHSLRFGHVSASGALQEQPQSRVFETTSHLAWTVPGEATLDYLYTFRGLIQQYSVRKCSWGWRARKALGRCFSVSGAYTSGRKKKGEKKKQRSTAMYFSNFSAWLRIFNIVNYISALLWLGELVVTHKTCLLSEWTRLKLRQWKLAAQAAGRSFCCAVGWVWSPGGRGTPGSSPGFQKYVKHTTMP